MFVTAIEAATGEGGEDIRDRQADFAVISFLSDIRVWGVIKLGRVCDKQAFHVESLIKWGHLLGY